MGYKGLFIGLLVISLSNAQVYKVCTSTTDNNACPNLDSGGSSVTCVPVSSRVECAVKIARGEADMGAFTEEELLLLGQMQPIQPTASQVIATIRDQTRTELPFSFEAVAIVPTNHSGGLAGLREGRYCHPGFDVFDIRWSPRVLKALEQSAANTNSCSGVDIKSKTPEEVEVETLSNFFSAACRPGPWSFNTTVDAALKQRFPNLCSMCGNGVCTGYNTNSAISVSGVNNNNRHIQALDCLVTNGTVAYVAWTHAREFFQIRNPQHVNQYAVLCPDSTLIPLSNTNLESSTSPCSIVKQPWRAIVASNANAAAIRDQLDNWWPNGEEPQASGWQSTLYRVLIGGVNFRVIKENLTTPLNYTTAIRPLPNMAAATSCFSASRWCTVTAEEYTKCLWLSATSYVMGLQPEINCELRQTTFQCLQTIQEDKADLLVVDTHYGYMARRKYGLSPVKLVQTERSSISRVAAFVKTAQTNVTGFESLRDKVACFPEYGGLAYVAFVRAAHERSIISASECDYARAVGEFFSGACAPGALDASHALMDHSDFNSTVLCTACRPRTPVNITSDFTCTWDYTNMYFGNNGSVACLTDSNTDVAFLETQNLRTQMETLNVDPMSFRALCRNNTLALNPGINIDDGCLLAYVVDAEVLTRRNDDKNNAINTMLDGLEKHFGYNIPSNEQLINLLIYSPFDGNFDLLFKDSTIALTEASTAVSHVPASNYMDMLSHLDACTGAAAPGPVPDLASRTVLSVVVLLIASFFSRLF